MSPTSQKTLRLPRRCQRNIPVKQKRQNSSRTPADHGPSIHMFVPAERGAGGGQPGWGPGRTHFGRGVGSEPRPSVLSFSASNIGAFFFLDCVTAKNDENILVKSVLHMFRMGFTQFGFWERGSELFDIVTAQTRSKSICNACFTPFCEVTTGCPKWPGGGGLGLR